MDPLATTFHVGVRNLPEEARGVLDESPLAEPDTRRRAHPVNHVKGCRYSPRTGLRSRRRVMKVDFDHTPHNDDPLKMDLRHTSDHVW
jgi:hypothetical protein